jgi:hypothetical protein
MLSRVLLRFRSCGHTLTDSSDQRPSSQRPGQPNVTHDASPRSRRSTKYVAATIVRPRRSPFYISLHNVGLIAEHWTRQRTPGAPACLQRRRNRQVRRSRKTLRLAYTHKTDNAQSCVRARWKFSIVVFAVQKLTDTNVMVKELIPDKFKPLKSVAHWKSRQGRHISASLLSERSRRGNNRPSSSDRC